MQTHATITQELHHVLEQTFNLYRATHLAHWNVRGPHFPQLHALFEEQYTELWTATDVLAERIRALGHDVEPTALAGGVTSKGKDATSTVHDLAATHRKMAKHLAQLEKHATEAGDPATADLFIERMRAHDQMGWMLEATSEGL